MQFAQLNHLSRRFTFRQANAATRSVPSSGRLSPMVSFCNFAHFSRQLLGSRVRDLGCMPHFKHLCLAQSTAWIPPVPTMVTLTCSWSASMCTTTRPLVSFARVEALCRFQLANKRCTNNLYFRRTLRAPRGLDGLGARNHGLCSCWSFRSALPPR